MKTKLFVTLLAVLILLTLAACGGSPLNSAAPANDRTASPRGGGTATTAPDSTETPADSTDEPQTGGDYTMEALLELPEDDADDYVYYEADDGNVYITRTSGAGEIAVIPSMINGKPVTQINRAFLNNNRIKAVVIPETVTSIGDSAFQANSKLEIVVIKGENLTSIGEQAFLVSKMLSTINLPDSVTTIGVMAFSGCSELKEIKFPESLKTIGSGAFFQTGLTTVVLPDGLEIIAANPFALCEDLETCYIPASVKEIDINLFGTPVNRPDVTIITPAGSYAEQYAIENDIKYKN